ncbi:hypothetical protein LXL04_007510 [Taraxacum kok-saghyz]
MLVLPCRDLSYCYCNADPDGGSGETEVVDWEGVKKRFESDSEFKPQTETETQQTHVKGMAIMTRWSTKEHTELAKAWCETRKINTQGFFLIHGVVEKNGDKSIVKSIRYLFRVKRIERKDYKESKGSLAINFPMVSRDPEIEDGG